MEEKYAPGRVLDAKIEERARTGCFTYTNGFPRVMELTPGSERGNKKEVKASKSLLTRKASHGDDDGTSSTGCRVG